MEEEPEGVGRQKGWRMSEEQSPLKQPSKGHMYSERLEKQSEDLHGSAPGPLHLNYSFQFDTLLGDY